jgi:hypothetical protein
MNLKQIRSFLSIPIGVKLRAGISGSKVPKVLRVLGVTS